MFFANLEKLSDHSTGSGTNGNIGNHPAKCLLHIAAIVLKGYSVTTAIGLVINKSSNDPALADQR